MTLLASTTVFHKKKQINLIFVIFYVLFVDARHILGNCRCQSFLLVELTTLFKVLHTFALFSFVYLLPSLTNGWPHTTLSVFEEDAIEYILRVKKWLDSFDSVFWKLSIEFFVVVFCCSFQPLEKLNKDMS